MYQLRRLRGEVSAEDHYAAEDTGIINIETFTGGVRKCFLTPPILVSRLANEKPS